MNQRDDSRTGARGIIAKIRFDKLRLAAIVLGTGLIVGQQIFKPNKRVIEAIIGVILMAILWGFSTFNSLLFLLLMYPFPFAISIGNSNFVFSSIIFLIYLIRVSNGLDKIYFDRKVTVPILLIIGSYVISFYNVDYGTRLFAYALVHTANMFSAIALMYMVINLIDDEEKLEKTLKIMVVSAVLVIAFTLIEMRFPGKVIVPNWLYTRHATRLVQKGFRMGGPFHDFELVAEYFAMHVLIFFFLYVRAKRMATKSLYLILLIIDLSMLFSTVTRGAFISLFIGIIYLTFLSRRDLNFVRLVMLTGAFALIIVVLEAVVAEYTTTGSLFERLFQTTLDRGIIPENRVAPWFGAIERGMQHPFIGNGPGWDFSGGLDVGLWPHNVYLFYFNITGIVGLASFIFLLVRLGKATLPGVKSSLVNSSFAEAFMKVLHVCFVMFIIDQIKIEYLRNDKYVFWIWFLFGLIIATANVIEKQKRERLETVPPE